MLHSEKEEGEFVFVSFRRGSLTSSIFDEGSLGLISDFATEAPAGLGFLVAPWVGPEAACLVLRLLREHRDTSDIMLVSDSGDDVFWMVKRLLLLVAEVEDRVCDVTVDTDDADFLDVIVRAAVERREEDEDDVRLARGFLLVPAPFSEQSDVDDDARLSDRLSDNASVERLGSLDACFFSKELPCL
nr:hypothetical protein BaRGS_021156 [Batillaria attramentaria]